MTTLQLTGEPLTIADVVAVARGGRPVALAPQALERVERARALVEQIVAEQRVCYGVTTGFGALSKVHIPTERLGELQHNLVRSHAAGVGEPLPPDAVRAMMLLTAASLARGASGVRRTVVEALLGLLNHGIVPLVPSRGSVGASGDLAPLAHIALVLIGEGQAQIAPTKGRRPTTKDEMHDRSVLGPWSVVDGAEALARVGLQPLRLEAKEGLALLNGTHLMAGMGALLLHDAWRLLHAAEVAAAMSLEGALGTHAALDPRIHALRPQPGQAASAARLRALLHGSAIPQSHRDDPRVQDPYSLRCVPQVLGAGRDALLFVEQAIANELGAVTDNPLLFVERPSGDEGGEVVSGGNFHGQPLATALDVLKIVLGQIAGFSERRAFLLLSAWEPEMRLTPFLTPQPGVQSGLMIAQYTAAALVAEIRALAQPASIASIPTSAGMEDWNSMGATGALQAHQALALARDVVAIELLCAAQALELHRPLRSGRGVEAAYERMRERVPALTADRPPAPDIAALAEMIAGGVFDIHYSARH